MKLKNPKRLLLATFGLALIYFSLSISQALIVTIGLWIFAYLVSTSETRKKEKAGEKQCL